MVGEFLSEENRILKEDRTELDQKTEEALGGQILSVLLGRRERLESEALPLGV